MSVRFVIGRTGTGKSKLFMDEITENLKESPSGNPLIYIVPDQMTFLSEYRLINTPGLKGMIRAQVFSLTRLAWRILQETGGISRTHISSAGLNMLIRKIVEDKKDHLKLFGRAADKTGFIEHVETMLTEFKRYCIKPEELAIENQEAPNSLKDKLHDLELIYHHFEEALQGKYLDTEDYMRLLAESIEKSTYLQDAEIYIDGFHSFTPQEYMVIGQLMRVCKRVSIALTLDQSFRTEEPDELHLFRMSGEAYQTLYKMALDVQAGVEDDVLLTYPHRYENRSIQYLESVFEKRPARPFLEDTKMRIFHSANRRAEIEGIAREIRRLVRTKGYRYMDFAILVRNGQDYQDVMETVFYDYEIPYFIDQKRPMFHHPLIELIRSTIETINSNWRYESVFRAVKTDLLFPLESNHHDLREKMDRLENYVIAYGIKGNKWVSKERWVYRRIRGLELENVPQTDAEKQMEHELNELRLFISAPINRLSRRLKNAKNGQELCEALFLYLEELDISAKLEKLCVLAEEKGDLVSAREHDQAWNAVIDLIDQFVDIFGEESISLKEFALIMDAGLEAMRFSLVPPAIDQVLVANLELSRLSDIKAAFVIGLNDGVMPARMSEEGILADSDREALLQNGIKIAPSSKTRLLDEEFIAYKAFTTPSNYLYLSYPLANEEGKALLPSPYLKRMKELFPNAQETVVVNDPSEINFSEQLEYVSHPNTAIAFLTSQLQQKKRGYSVPDFWWDVYNYYIKSAKWKQPTVHILSSLFYQNKAKQITEKTSKELYGDKILASVSRMELFHGCPFSHFATHGLKLRERQIYKLEAPDIGDLFHGALKWISDEIRKHGLSWSSLTKDQCNALAKEAVAYLAPKLQHQILLSSNRHHYIKRKLEQVIGRASLVLSQQSKQSGFVPIGMELDFGAKSELPPLTFTLRNGTKMELQGRIDRVDKAEDDNGVYLRVIDYKSSARTLDLTEVYYGLALQMLTYLDIVVTNSKTLVGTDGVPAGVLYFHLHNPIVKSNKILTLEEIEEEIFKSFKMKGLMLDDANVVKLMDQSLESGTSKIVSAELKKDGTLSARSQVAGKEDFKILHNYVRNLYEKSGNAISSGVVDINPYQLKKRTPCEFCSYKSVCQFDQSLDDNQYRILTPEKPNDLLNLIREEVLSGENNYSN
ncbi:ATP-dependent helicase [Heyndrickxia shackletonii]|uniref:ATP-dependent helicase/deoxyribonuclease subunit B n=1 Tax=Heyndrickxia shackletonii TaxID=157838 RepID=A0A0Q3WZW7_9BACI|nr:helicase-exonuclease AddAB subunit AddB [Heyndrickxia shackletonii]KQL55020.1 ATP-dependent helicase [Heyndrickxia shackletonii]NEZ01476.1 helicase-exonuclease AddAB subunit AddB [Heyndrickxia shackletonii]